jgi:hypothetical protein
MNASALVRALNGAERRVVGPSYCVADFNFGADSWIRGKNWGLGLALERILAWWQAAAVFGVHGVRARGERCSS